MLYVFYGGGEGKTTAALGKGLRALGHGMGVVVIQFLKKRESGEYLFQGHLEDFDIHQFGRKQFVYSPIKKDFQLANEGLKFVKDMKDYPEVLILDEVLEAIGLKLVLEEDLLRIIKKIPKKTLIILTGRKCPRKILKEADVVTEFKKVKHWFDKGVRAKKGVNY